MILNLDTSPTGQLRHAAQLAQQQKIAIPPAYKKQQVAPNKVRKIRSNLPHELLQGADNGHMH